jgi:hypothetical protein
LGTLAQGEEGGCAQRTALGVGHPRVSGSTIVFSGSHRPTNFASKPCRRSAKSGSGCQKYRTVLCNFVLTTGFDAPKTDMTLISRLVFSPVRYMQMVGRGLRGKKNCGTRACRIVTVLDNLGRYKDQHPYHYCRHYFAEEST